jgi:hypothetical protein
MNRNTNHTIDNNVRRGGKDLSADTKVPKRQKTTITKGEVRDMSTGVIDIDDTPDVATWNKNLY